MKRREHSQIKMYDYISKEEFEKHRIQMEDKGWHLIKEGMFNGTMNPTYLDDEVWKYTACFIKSDLM